MKADRMSWQKRLLSAVLLTVIVLTGCGSTVPEPEKETGEREYDLSPLFLPGQKHPDLTANEDGLMFQWPEEDWLFLNTKEQFSVVDQDVTRQVWLQLTRQQLKTAEIPWRRDALSPETLSIMEIKPLIRGFLILGETDENEGLLIHLQDLESGEYRTLTGVNSKAPLFHVSPDGSKVAYINAEQEKLTAYHSVTGRATVLSALDIDDFCQDWTKHIHFSPLGGYLTVETIDCETGRPVQFTTYGADTGRLIHSPLPGVKPVWDPQEKTIAFFMDTALTNRQSASDSIEDNSGETDTTDLPQDHWVQIGMYHLDRREMEFLNRVPEGSVILSPPVFSSQERFILYPIRQEGLDQLVMYHVDRRVQATIAMQDGRQIIPGKNWCHFDYPRIVVPLQNDMEFELMLLNFETDVRELITPILPWGEESRETLFYADPSSQKVFYLQKNRIMKASEGSHEVVMPLPAGAKTSQMIVLGDWLLITLNKGLFDRILQLVSL